MAKYLEWIRSTYRDLIHLDDVADLFAAAGAQELYSSWSAFSSSLWTHSTFYDLRYNIVLQKGGYYTTSFKLQHKDADVVYAILYSSCSGRTPRHEYVCLHYTYASMDGEFRRNFVRYEQVAEALSMSPAASAKLEEYYLAQLSSGKYIPHCETIGGDQAAAVNASIDRNRLPIVLLIAHWFAAVGPIVMTSSTIPDHISEKYTKVLIDPSRAFVSGVSLEECSAAMMHIRAFKLQGDVVRLGQKFTIPTLTESREPMDISHKLWREIFIAERVGALVVSGITSSLPLFGSWFIIDGSSPMLFDNVISYQKLMNSERGLRASKHIATARGYTSAGKHYHSQGLEQLDNELVVAQDAVEESTILAEEVICQVVEDVGVTWGNLLQNAEARMHGPATGPLLSNAWMFSKYMFEILWALLAINERSGVIHGDLHLNNTTMGTNTNEYVQVIPRCVFRTGKTLYCFPHYGRRSYIIDFSRSLLSPAALADSGLPGEMQRRAAIDQRSRYLGLIAKFRPEYYERNRPAFIAASERDPGGIWQVLRVVDPLQYFTGVRDVLLTYPHSPAILKRLAEIADTNVIRREILPMLNGIVDYCNAYLDAGLRELVTSQAPLHRENPSAEIIHQHFAAYELQSTVNMRTTSDTAEAYAQRTTDKLATQQPVLVDYLSLENPAKYSITDPAKFPPLSNIDDLVAVGFLKVDPDARRNVNRFRANRAAGPSIVKKYAEAAQARHEELRAPIHEDESDIEQKYAVEPAEKSNNLLASSAFY